MFFQNSQLREVFDELALFINTVRSDCGTCVEGKIILRNKTAGTRGTVKKVYRVPAVLCVSEIAEP